MSYKIDSICDPCIQSVCYGMEPTRLLLTVNTRREEIKKAGIELSSEKSNDLYKVF